MKKWRAFSRKKSFLIRKSTFLFAEIGAFLFAENDTLLFTVYRCLTFTVKYHNLV